MAWISLSRKPVRIVAATRDRGEDDRKRTRDECYVKGHDVGLAGSGTDAKRRNVTFARVFQLGPNFSTGGPVLKYAMDLNKLTEQAAAAVTSAQEQATRLGNQTVEVEHLFYALITQENGLVPRLLERLKISMDLLLSRTQAALERIPKVTGAGATGQSGITHRLNQLLLRAQDEAKKLKDEYVSVEHLMLAMFEERKDTEVDRLLRDQNITRDAFLATMQEVRGNQRVTSQNPEAIYEALQKYGRDLTALARQNKLDPVIGRDMEIRRTVQVLSRRTKNNPGPHRRTGRGQDGHRGGSGPAHRGAGCAGKSARERRSSRSIWGR